MFGFFDTVTCMAKPSDTASLNHILFRLLCLVIIAGSAGTSPKWAQAQHQIDPETWIEMRKMFRPKGPAPTIEEDIAALAGPEARRAGPRLIDRGPEALPAVHAALRSDEIELLQAQRLLHVIRDIGDKSSVPVVVEFISKDKQSPLRRDALLVLALIPATEESASLIIGIANDAHEKWNTYRMVFTWFGLHRDPRGRPYAEKIRNEPDPEKQAAGLFVLARLGDKAALEPISRMLAEGPPANSRDILMLSLAELATPEEFESRAPSSLAWSKGYKDSLLYARYRDAAPEDRAPLCLEMLRSQRPEHLELAVRCLLENGRTDDLRPMAAIDLEAPGRSALIRNDIRKAGWRIIDTDDEFSIVPNGAGEN